MVKRTVYFSNPARLHLRQAQLEITLTESNTTTTLPLEDLGMVVLDHPAITLTHGLIAGLLAENVAVITCDEKRMPTGLLLPLDGHYIQSERFSAQIRATTPLRKNLWAQTVTCKVRNQASLLVQRGYDADALYRWAKNVKSGDGSNIEARAAATYWKHLMAHIPDFTRDREGIPPNNFLNYGYAILRSIVARALVANGLLPTLGIHHSNRYNAYCLADDIMEPYRPYVDRLVLHLVADDPEPTFILETRHKKVLLGLPTLDVRIDDKQSPLMVAVQRTAASLVKCYEGEQRKILYPEMEWYITSANDSAPTR